MVEECAVVAVTFPAPTVAETAVGDQQVLGVQHNDFPFRLKTDPVNETLHTVPASVGRVVFRQRDHDPVGPYAPSCSTWTLATSRSAATPVMLHHVPLQVVPYLIRAAHRSQRQRQNYGESQRQAPPEAEAPVI